MILSRASSDGAWYSSTTAAQGLSLQPALTAGKELSKYHDHEWSWVCYMGLFSWVSMQGRMPGTKPGDFWVGGHFWFFHDRSLFPSSAALTVQSSPSFSVSLSLLRMSSISCRPAGDFPATGSLRDLAAHQPSHCYTSHLQHRGCWQSCSLSCKWPVCGVRGYTGHKRVGNHPPASHLSFRSTSKTFLRLIAVWEGNFTMLSLEIRVSQSQRGRGKV